MRAVHHSGSVWRVGSWVQYLFGVLLPLLLLTLLAAVLFLLAVFWAAWDLSLDLSANRPSRHGHETPLFCPFLPNFGMTERPDKLRWCQSFCLVPRWRSYGIRALFKYIQLLSMLGNCKHPSCAIESSLKVNETDCASHKVNYLNIQNGPLRFEGRGGTVVILQQPFKSAMLTYICSFNCIIPHFKRQDFSILKQYLCPF